MRIGITCNIQGRSAVPHGAPDDAEEEFDKPETVEAIAAVLSGLGHRVEVLGDGPPLLRRLLDDPPDFVFNFAEGTGVSRSREARVPAVLEMLGIPYSGSDPLTLSVTLDKDCAKRLVRSAGVATPNWVLIEPELPRAPAKADPLAAPSSLPASAEWDRLVVLERIEAARLAFPLILKPAYEGSSKGIRAGSLVESPDELVRSLVELEASYRQPVLVEEFIAGDEVTVGVIGNDPPRLLGMMQVLPSQATDRFVYSLEVKRDYKRAVCYKTPPELPAEVLGRLERAALTAYAALDCTDVSRVDFRVRGGEPWFLEVNPLPGLHPENSDLVLMARGYGIDHAELVRQIFAAACARHGIDSRAGTEAK
jgi:D-alanine-D-alanine ligase